MHSEDVYALGCYINRTIDAWLKEAWGAHEIYVSDKVRKRLVDKLVDVLTDEPYGKGSSRYKENEKKEQIKSYYKALKQ